MDKNQLVLDRLLSEIGQRLDGALDTWTLVCFPPMNQMQDPKGFLLYLCDNLRSLIVATQCLFPAGDEIWNKLKESSQHFQKAFLTLLDFRDVPFEQVRSATNTIAEVYHLFQNLLRKAGESYGIEVTYFQMRTPEKEKYLQSILDRLLDLFSQELAPSQPVHL